MPGVDGASGTALPKPCPLPPVLAESLARPGGGLGPPASPLLGKAGLSGLNGPFFGCFSFPSGEKPQTRRKSGAGLWGRAGRLPGAWLGDALTSPSLSPGGLGEGTPQAGALGRPLCCRVAPGPGRLASFFVKCIGVTWLITQVPRLSGHSYSGSSPSSGALGSLQRPRVPPSRSPPCCSPA